MHFAGTGSKVGTMLINVNKSVIITVNEYYILSRLIKGKIKNTYTVNTTAVKHIF